MTLRPCVFLDRDGTLNRDVGYLSRAEDLELLPGAAEAVARFNRAGVLAVVVTNQSGLARGYFDEAALDAIHARLAEALARAGARLDAVHHSPYHAEGIVERWRADHETRKPRTGMIDRALAELPIDRARSFVAGDSLGDVELARNAGMRAVLVLTGSGRETLARLRAAGAPPPDFVASDLREAADWILARLAAPSAEGRSGLRPDVGSKSRPTTELSDTRLESGIDSPETVPDVGSARRILLVGDFDPFRGAHVATLEAAARRGSGDRDALVVAVRGDRRMRRARGDGRPYVAEAERVEIVASLRGVAEAVAFSEADELRAILNRVRPVAAVVAIPAGAAGEPDDTAAEELRVARESGAETETLPEPEPPARA